VAHQGSVADHVDWKNIAMANTKLGKLPRRYSFILNPYPNERLSKCPKCHRPTHLRKFALLIHIDEWGLMALGKTCRYCTRCELIIAHQDELEAELAYSFRKIAPRVIGNKYMVVGTVEKSIWQSGLTGSGIDIGEVLKHTADFKKVLDLEVEPGGWYPASEE
jgi:hypothetical protein